MNSSAVSYSPSLDLLSRQSLTSRLRRFLWPVLGAAALITAAIPAASRIRFALAHETTDDAQVEGHISPVLPRIGGYVARVLVDDNQHVHAGQPVLEIDPAELELKIASAQSAFASANAAVASAGATRDAARAAAAVAVANTTTARVAQSKAAADLARDEQLHATNILSAQEFSDSQAVADLAAARLQSALREADAAASRVAVAAAEVASAESQVSGRAAELSYARLQRTYATVLAPIDGIVSRKNAEPGQFVPAGQTLMSIAGDTDLWVVANFKETQLARMQPGQEVEISIDGQPGLVVHGRIDSLAGATGARFALLPPDNSTCNFVKVTQRVPVKIIPDATPAAARIRPGMSAVANVRIAPTDRSDARQVASSR